MTLECLACGLPDKIILANEIFICNEKNYKDFPYKEIIQVDSSGICNKCSHYQKIFNSDDLKKQIKAFTNLKASPKAEYDAIVAYSGGKDSTITLYLAKEILGMNVMAYTLDNGFIPEKVQKRSQGICEQLKIPLVTVRDDIYKDFLDNYHYDQENQKWFTKTEKDLCSSCSRKIFKNLEKLLEKYHIERVITGLNTYLKLHQHRISAINKTYYYSDDHQRKHYWHLALPYAMQINITKQQEILKKVSWYEIDFKGYTSNCLIPGFTEGFCSSKDGYSFDAAYLAKEKRSGYFTNAEELFIDFREPKTMSVTDHQAITDFFKNKNLI
jgi:hypothetical protein